MKFLITVKSPDLRTYLENLIKINNDDCFSVDNAMESIDAYREYKPRFVILDIDLRNNLGFRIAEDLKKEFPDAVLLLVSDSDEVRIRKRSNKIDNATFILKENLFELYKVIERIKQS